VLSCTLPAPRAQQPRAQQQQRTREQRANTRAEVRAATLSTTNVTGVTMPLLQLVKVLRASSAPQPPPAPQSLRTTLGLKTRAARGVMTSSEASQLALQMPRMGRPLYERNYNGGGAGPAARIRLDDGRMVYFKATPTQRKVMLSGIAAAPRSRFHPRSSSNSATGRPRSEWVPSDDPRHGVLSGKQVRHLWRSVCVWGRTRRGEGVSTHEGHRLFSAAATLHLARSNPAPILHQPYSVGTSGDARRPAGLPQAGSVAETRHLPVGHRGMVGGLVSASTTACCLLLCTPAVIAAAAAPPR